MKNESKIYIAGHTGMVGSAILRELHGKGYENLLLRTRDQLDLLRQTEVEAFFEKESPEVVIIAAAKVGGVLYNETHRAEFIYENLMIESNIIHASYLHGVNKLLFLGSSCIYPREAPQPIKEEYLLTSKLEPTNEPYAIAKIAGIKLCENYHRQFGSNFFSIMPTNLYGPNDDFGLETSHVVPALIRKFHEAKISNSDTVTVWGTGTPRREFLYVDDLAEACSSILRNIEAHHIYDQGITHLNIGCGDDITISELSQLVRKTVGYRGEIMFDTLKPDGIPRKLLDISRIKALGWEPKIPLEKGLKKTFDWYNSQIM